MQISRTDFEKLRELEESMWRTEKRFDRKFMEDVLSPDFFEFGRSGRIYKREETLATVGAQTQDIKARLPLKDFEVHSISDDIVLITYVSIIENDKVEMANRSSIWLKTSRGWQLRFHQGTPVNKG